MTTLFTAVIFVIISLLSIFAGVFVGGFIFSSLEMERRKMRSDLEAEMATRSITE